jgi:hypothetical protein
VCFALAAGPGGTVIYGHADSGPGVSLLRAPPTDGQAIGSLRDRIFPRFNMYTFTFIISMIQIVMFIITLIVGGARFDGAFVKGNNMLGPSAITFFWMGKILIAITCPYRYCLYTPALISCALALCLMDRWQMGAIDP